jgi:hypothetical protein
MNTGSFGRIGGTANNVNAIEKQRTDQLNEKLSDDFFRGMIDTRGIKK